LLSRDLNDQDSHKKGLSMLENLIIKRGGLEGKNKSEYKNFLNQREFEAFFQQIKPFLTVQEQVDLYLELLKRGSLEAGFLAFLSLTAIGFSKRKPEKLFEARKLLKKLNLSGLDSMPLIGCLDLLLADVDQSSSRFLSSSDENLKNWLNNYSGDKLEAICIFCKNWLENDVLVGYRDIEPEEIDLDSWFEDREIQDFIEELEKKSNKISLKPKFQNQKKFLKQPKNIKDEDSEDDLENPDERRLPWPGGIKEREEQQVISENEFNKKILKNKSVELYKYFLEKVAEFRFSFGELLGERENLNKSPYLLVFYAFLILFAFGLGIGFLRDNFKKSNQEQILSDEPLLISDKNKDLENTITTKDDKNKSFSEKEDITIEIKKNNPLLANQITKASPSLDDLSYILNIWLLNKNTYLSGESEISLANFVQDGLIRRTIEQRESDIKKGIYRDINSQIQKLDLLSQTSSRIVVLAELKYSEKTIRNSGEIIDETLLNPLKVKYILGFSNNSWKLADFVSGQ